MGEITLSGSGAGGYEKTVIWAEESGALSNNNTQWSYGNGATGNIGIPLLEDWEIYGLSFHADTASANATVLIELMDFSNAPSVITRVQTANQGQTNNYVYVGTIPPIAVPEGTVIGFRTDIEIGTISDARCAVWLRRKGD